MVLLPEPPGNTLVFSLSFLLEMDSVQEGSEFCPTSSVLGPINGRENEVARWWGAHFRCIAN